MWKDKCGWEIFNPHHRVIVITAFDMCKMNVRNTSPGLKTTSHIDVGKNLHCEKEILPFFSSQQLNIKFPLENRVLTRWGMNFYYNKKIFFAGQKKVVKVSLLIEFTCFLIISTYENGHTRVLHHKSISTVAFRVY